MCQSRTRILALLILCVGSMLISCSVSKRTGNVSPAQSSHSSSPKILFLNYEIRRNRQDSTYTARLINKLVSEGSLKTSATRPPDAVTGDLELQVLDEHQHIINTIPIPNPLDKSVEFVNDAGDLEQKVISLDAVEFSVRLQLEAGAHFTLLKRITGTDTESTVLLKTSIQ